MKELQISREELMALPEYSCSIPTGKTIGKRWRVNVNAYRKDRIGVPAEWMVFEYAKSLEPGMLDIIKKWAIDENGNVHRG